MIGDARLSVLSPIIMPHVRGCPRPVIDYHLRLAAIEFCERTRLWRHSRTNVAPTRITDIAPPTPTLDAVTPEVFELEAVTFDGIDLRPVVYDAAASDAMTADPRYGIPNTYTTVETNRLLLDPFPQVGTGTLRYSYFGKPSMARLFALDAADPMHDVHNTVPQFMIAQYGKTLADGALALLQAIPGQAFTDENMAAVNRSKFDMAVSGLTQKFLRGQQKSPARIVSKWM